MKTREGVLKTTAVEPRETQTPGPRRGFALALVAFAGVLAVGGLSLVFGGEETQVVDPSTPPTPTTALTPTPDSTLPPELGQGPGPFLGTWITTDSRYNEGSATMVIEASEDESVEMMAHNLATLCLPAPTTMIGTGRLQADVELVIPAPVFTCDDGSQPDHEFEAQYQNLTLTRDPETDILTDNFGGVWIREGAEDKGPESTIPHSEAEVTELLTGFLEARVAGEGAQLYLNVPAKDIPLLYTTTSGARYARADFEEVSGFESRYGSTAFKVRLFAGDTVVEQIFTIGPAGRLGLDYPGSLGTGGNIAPTTEDGQPVAVPTDLFGGEVTLHIAHPWVSSGPAGSIILIPEGSGPTTDGGERHDWDRLWLMADPFPAGTHCLTGPAPADAEALAESIRSDPDLDTTAPVTVNVGGAEALMMDLVGTGPIVHACNEDPGGSSVLSYGEPIGLTRGYRLRLYLFDAPEGSSMRILAVAIDLPESRFERAVEGPDPVVEFHTR